MRTASFKPVTSVVLPIVAPLTLAVVVLERSLVPDGLERWLGALPPVIFVTVAVLAWRFNLSRLALATLVIAAADQVLRRLPAGASASIGFDLVTLLIPIHLGWLAYTAERGLVSGRGLVRVAALAVATGAAAWLGSAFPVAVSAILDPGWLPAAPDWAEPLSGATRLAFALALSALAFRLALGRGALDGGLVGLLIASFLAVTQPIGSDAYSIYLIAAGLVLSVSLVELSHALAYRDELTGLPGRRAFNDALKRLARRYTIAMIDIDHFKRFNDRFGHEIGDQALRMVAGRLERVTGGGRAFRYGGEEFVIIFRGKDTNQAEPHLEALRKAVAGSPFSVRSPNRPRRRPPKGRRRPRRGRRVRVTVSIGAANRDGRRPNADEVILVADKLLYRAKRTGRNRLEC